MWLSANLLLRHVLPTEVQLLEQLRNLLSARSTDWKYQRPQISDIEIKYMPHTFSQQGKKANSYRRLTTA